MAKYTKKVKRTSGATQVKNQIVTGKISRKTKDKEKTTVSYTKFPEKKSVTQPPQPRGLDQVKTLPQRAPVKDKTFVDRYDLPASYNSTYLTLMPRDPYWIHAYWEIGQDSTRYLQNTLGSEMEQATYTLRMYDVTLKDFDGTNANNWFDLDVGTHTNNWYVNLWSGNISFCAELGMRTASGRFVPIARSNFVTTPRQSASNRSDIIWMEEQKGRYRPFVTVPQRRKVGKVAASYPRGSKRGKIYLTEDDIRAYYSKLFPLLRLVISARSKVSGEKLDVALYGKYLKGAGFLDKYLMGDLSRHQFLKKIILGSSEELLVVGGASEQQVPGGASEREVKKKKFYFEIGTELIVYGRTEPDAEVWLGDKKIKLRPDGTFTLRCALPEGKIPLDLLAIANDKTEKRRITTSAIRTHTDYSH